MTLDNNDYTAWWVYNSDIFCHKQTCSEGVQQYEAPFVDKLLKMITLITK